MDKKEKVFTQKNIKSYYVKSIISIIYLFILMVCSASLNSIFTTRTASSPFYTPLLIFLSLVIISFILINFIVKSKEETFDLEKQKKYYKTQEFPSFLAITISTFLFITLFISPMKVSGISMQGSLYDGDMVLVSTVKFTPKVDDIVIVDIEHITTDHVDTIVKRVVAVPGDEVEYISGDLYINGQFSGDIKFGEFLKCINSKDYDVTKTILEDNHYILLGDNRAHSSDSRDYGAFHVDYIAGKVLMRIAPLNKIGAVNKEVLY